MKHTVQRTAEENPVTNAHVMVIQMADCYGRVTETADSSLQYTLVQTLFNDLRYGYDMAFLRATIQRREQESIRFYRGPTPSSPRGENL